MFSSLKEGYSLANGVKIPCVGYGTYKTPDGDICVEGVKNALQIGYRHIDTAEFYGNEESVGEGIRESGIARKDVFVTTKVWNTHQGFKPTIEAFEESKRKLGLDQIDLYLIHWPSPKPYRNAYPDRFIDTWRALEKLYKSGEVHAIGVCNCLPKHLKDLLRVCDVAPMVNQIEMHIGYPQDETVAFCKEHRILVEAWAPLCKAKAFGTEPLRSIALAHGVDEGQVLVRWVLQKGCLPMPKSVTPSRIASNADVFGFQLSDEEMSALDAFDGVSRLGSHPDTAEF